MDKILTVSVAGYNVENFIRQNLDSMTDPEIVNQLEVFVVDDGGTDNTLEIAREYENRWPDTFHAIHKDNGGYGSTVNYSLAHATGKYFRMLDGDDWFDTEGLRRLIKFLQSSDVDAVVTQYLSGEESSLQLKGVLHRVIASQTYAIKDFHVENYVGMWALTIKTDKLRESGLLLPEHTLYTDQYFCTIPFAVLHTIQYCDFPVYCYRIGREEQSVSRSSRIRHYKDALNNCKELCLFCEKNRTNVNYTFILYRVVGYYRNALRTIILLDSDKARNLFVGYENTIKNICHDVYEQVTKSGKFGKLINIVRKTNYRLFFLLSMMKSNWT